jgi:AraC family transcriptional regulator
MRAGTVEDYRKRILRVLVHIQNHLDGPLPLDELAAVSRFSPFHFHRIFRGLVGESVKEHVRRLRLERAAHRLRFTGQPVTEIAFDAGYQTHESFTRAFRAMFRESPAEFRKHRRAVAYGPAPSGVHFVTGGTLDDFRPARRAAPPPEVRVEELPAMRVAFLRHVGPYDEVGAAWERLCAWAGSRGLFKSAPLMIGIVYDDPEITAPDKVRYDAALVVSGEIAAEGDIGAQQVGGGKYAVATHRGPHQRVSETYVRVCGEWLPHSGRELLPAPALEFYRNSPQNTRPEDLLTDIYLPLAV